MPLNILLERLRTRPAQVEFTEVIAVIESMYDFVPTPFVNGDVENAAGENSGSCKILAFARAHGLDAESTLACFGNYYRTDVLGKPDGDDHRNIRAFTKTGWDGVRFERDPLVPRADRAK